MNVLGAIEETPWQLSREGLSLPSDPNQPPFHFFWRGVLDERTITSDSEAERLFQALPSSNAANAAIFSAMTPPERQLLRYMNEFIIARRLISTIKDGRIQGASVESVMGLIQALGPYYQKNLNDKPLEAVDVEALRFLRNPTTLPYHFLMR